MIKHIFSIRDSKADIFNNPFYANTEGEAIRSFTTAANDAKTSICTYPEDFDLYYMGTYDDNKGQFQALDTPKHLRKGIECISKERLAGLTAPPKDPMA